MRKNYFLSHGPVIQCCVGITLDQLHCKLAKEIGKKQMCYWRGSAVQVHAALLANRRKLRVLVDQLS